MKLKTVAEACMWLPGFSPDEDPLEVLGVLGMASAPVIANPSSSGAESAVMEVLECTQKATWPRLDASIFTRLSGAVSKFEANLAAIEVLRKLEAENREPNDQEREALNLYTGWGGLPQAFNENQPDKAWSERATKLKSVLSETEHASAQDSTLNAHYTPVEVVEAMWSAVRRLGFTGGRIVEPAAGVGYFMGAMPTELASKSTVTAIEIDSISARMAKALYTSHGVRVLNAGFECANLPESYYDLAISNVPFGKVQVPELRNVPFANFTIHNYFFAKAMEVVRPGGLVAFITSSYTMDAYEDNARAYLESQGELVAAIRLPQSTFTEIANTKVTTDIIILKKHATQGARSEGGAKWLNAMPLPSGSPINGSEYYSRSMMIVNEYFAAHPRQVIGKLSVERGQHRDVVVCKHEGNLVQALNERVELLPTDCYEPRTEKTPRRAQASQDIQLEDAQRQGLVIIDGKVYEVHGNQATPYKAAAKVIDRIKALIQVRDAARKLIAAQVVSGDDALLGVYRLALSVSYDAFVAAHGLIHDKANRQAFKDDPDLPLLMSLEHYDEEKKVAEKAAIFTRRTVGSKSRIKRCESALEALQVSLSESAEVDSERIAALTGTPVDEVMRGLEDGGHVYLDPVTQQWESADAYLSGNVRKKLAVARTAGLRFARNAEALEKVLPADLGPGEITARIGSTWIPARTYGQFMDELLSVTGHCVSFDAVTGTWSVDAPWETNRSIVSTQTYGTSRINAPSLVEKAMNQQEPTIYSNVNGKPVANTLETIAAREKQYLLKEKFVEWLWSDETRAKSFADQYNIQFNSIVPRQFNGAHLLLPGLSDVYKLRPHQMNGIWRIISSEHNTLLAHAVGAGKTLAMICAGMELRRIGKASKPLYVVPNHMLFQFAKEFMLAYPGANILAASKDDLQGDRRRVLLSKIATGDFDAVLITHASFERIRMSAEYMESYVAGEIREISDALRAQSDLGSANRIVKQLARAKKTWEAKLKKLSGEKKKDDLLTFEELGVDWIMYDESQAAKNLWRFTKMNRIAGLPNSNSERAFDMFVKTRYLMGKRGDGVGLTFATATPCTNSMSEIWTVQRYLQQDALDAAMVGNFDAWAANFGESVTSLEIAPDGSGYRMQTRFAKFVNLPELMAMFRQVADIQTADMLDLPVPKAHMLTVTAQPTQQLKDYVQTLVDRAEKVKGGGASTSKDNMLVITNDGRKAALDMRLVDALAQDHEDSKIDMCAKNVHEIWLKHADTKGTQIVFCDLSTPSQNGRFNAYDDLRNKLIRKGIPENEIAFIHDYDTDSLKEKLFASVRCGAVRVILGSTSKLGVGTNVQDRLVALHHLDAPWRPSDVEQREGRIIRQGNLNEEVWIYRYVTVGSFDVYVWQILEAKARFIAQVMRGNCGLRSVEDAELAALSFAEVKALASGNPLVLEKAGVDSELVKLSILRNAWERQHWSNRNEAARLSVAITQKKKELSCVRADIEALNKVNEDGFSMQVEGIVFDDETQAAKALTQALQQLKRDSKTHTVGVYRGFAINASREVDGEVFIHVAGNRKYDVHHPRTALALVHSVIGVLNALRYVEQDETASIRRMESRLVELNVVMLMPFEKQARLDALQKRKIEIETALDLSKGDLTAVEELAQAEDAVEA